MRLRLIQDGIFSSIRRFEEAPKVVDITMMNGAAELPVLRLRLDVLQDVVDTFCVTVGSMTFSGHPRVFETFCRQLSQFQEEVERDFRDHPTLKTVYIFWTDLQGFDHRSPDDTGRLVHAQGAWRAEYVLRQASLANAQRVVNAAPAVGFLCDLDEVPSPEAVRYYTEHYAESKYDAQTFFPTALNLQMHYYFLNTPAAHSPVWPGPIVGRIRDLKHAQTLRDQRWTLGNQSWNDQFHLPRGGTQHRYAGWHWSYLGSPEDIRYKIDSYAHRENATPEYMDLTTIAEKRQAGRDLFGRNETYAVGAGHRSDIMPTVYPAAIFNPRFKEYLKPEDGETYALKH